MSVVDQISKLIQPLATRVHMYIARAVIDTINDETKVQQLGLKLFVGEMKDKVERFSNNMVGLPLHFKGWLCGRRPKQWSCCGSGR
jgi:hypothetical protein